MNNYSIEANSHSSAFNKDLNLNGATCRYLPLSTIESKWSGTFYQHDHKNEYIRERNVLSSKTCCLFTCTI